MAGCLASPTSRPRRGFAGCLGVVAGLAKGFFIAVVVTAAVAQWDDVVNRVADRCPALSSALLAKAAVALPDPLSILHASPAAHALGRFGPRWGERR
jgi:hypothetical protein